ncbi:Alpha-ketoglutarate-dependent taurine dioxygenase [Alphaproteobacteria bacterium SO-S41]|nr:Alpha-ketoglutarate-dependent taurine dioxygenase [Alphaproteobacteria bacterium SO-S41]
MNVAVKPESYTHFEARPLSPTIGAELIGFDIAHHNSDTAIEDVRRALLQWKVVFFRDQDITRAQHIAFARRFGELEIHPATPKDQEDPEVLRIAHGANSKGSENNWHSDVTWRAEPSLGSILRAIEVPDVGGDTLFADMYAAYDALDPAFKKFVEGLTAEHDIARVFAKRLGANADALRAKFPIQQHPVIRTHPETGRNGIYVNIGFTERVLGLSRKQSDWVLNELYEQAKLPEFQCRFRWKPGSLAFWDNRACQHYAASDYFPLVRIMERVTVKGDRPFFRG